MSASRYSIGIDTGGTFTDVVARGSDGSLRLAKVPSTRADPGEAVRRAIGEVLAEWGIAPQSVKRFVHGTTVATNAVLERKGARIGLIATEGFTDVIEIGRQNRRQIYELLLEPETPAFLAPGSRRVGVTEGVGPDGVIETPLDEASLAAAVERLQAEGVEAVAVCLLFAFANPEHERRIGAYLRERFPDLPVSLSSEVDPAFREYERTCVTAFDAYVKPRLDRYLGRMQADLDAAGVPAALQIMHSRGGICSSEVARRRPVRLFLSGPAAGVIGACAAGSAVGARDLVTIDIGGTSSDIALISGGKPLIRPEGLLDNFTIRVPMVDVNAIGAGGGSIAWIDAGGGLRVGPESAGADPGPACYGRGGREATVTDASVALGYLDPDYFAGGALALDAEKAREAIRTRVAEPLNLTLDEAALGIHRVVNAQMAEGIRLVSISRGVDPRAFTLVALGGGGPVHATALADELGMSRVVVPRYPGVLSADGLLAAAVEHEASSAFPRSLAETDMAEVRATFDRLDRECDALMALERLDGGTVERSYHADVCYVGQAHYIETRFDLEGAAPLDRLYADFCAMHDQLYGHHTAAPAKIVNLRAVHRVEAAPRAAEPPPEERAGSAPRRREILVRHGRVEAEVYSRDRMAPGMTVRGPAIVEQNDTTTLIEPGWRCDVAGDGTLVLTKEDMR